MERDLSFFWVSHYLKSRNKSLTQGCFSYPTEYFLCLIPSYPPTKLRLSVKCTTEQRWALHAAAWRRLVALQPPLPCLGRVVLRRFLDLDISVPCLSRWQRKSAFAENCRTTPSGPLQHLPYWPIAPWDPEASWKNLVCWPHIQQAWSVVCRCAQEQHSPWPSPRAKSNQLYPLLHLQFLLPIFPLILQTCYMASDYAFSPYSLIPKWQPCVGQDGLGFATESVKHSSWLLATKVISHSC